MKKFVSILAIIFCVSLFVGCGASKLSSNYSEDKLKSASEEVITNLNNGKYKDVINTGSDELRKQLPEAKLKEAFEGVKNKVGKYESIEKMSFQEKDGVAVVIAIAKYENGKVQFTLSYDKDMKLVGIYMK
ncbi:DUF3887 domain-containing protein [Eubacterium multiforme]|uniref:DUF3887 domain-containing protein n=1 Tax=Eubacterium multiforme TaxID=83339 RepID=A0ABT9UX76_9FIRM|nr:DUF3887 domain-containing protein [Eubacterium multiforme]MDQ0150913.1 hypothetical protein [Eubacterium multiforme]